MMGEAYVFITYAIKKYSGDYYEFGGMTSPYPPQWIKDRKFAYRFISASRAMEVADIVGGHVVKLTKWVRR